MTIQTCYMCRYSAPEYYASFLTLPIPEDSNYFTKWQQRIKEKTAMLNPVLARYYAILDEQQQQTAKTEGQKTIWNAAKRNINAYGVK